MADYFTHFAFTLSFATPEIADAALADFTAMSEAVVEDGDHVGVTATRVEKTSGEIFVSDEEGAPDLDMLGVMILVLGKKHGLTGRFGFQFADTCSKARPDAFAGGAVALDFDEQALSTTHTSTMLKLTMRDSDAEDWFPPDLDRFAAERIDAA